MENKNTSEPLRRINEKFGEAEKLREKDFFETHLSDELIFFRASGVVNNKEEFLTDLKDPEKKYHEIRTDIQGIFLTKQDTLAMVTALVYAKLTKNGNDIEGNFMNVRVFRMEGDVWKLISWYNYEV